MSPSPPFVIDSHCHLDAAVFDADRLTLLARAAAAGVGALVVPATSPSNFEKVVQLSHQLQAEQDERGVMTAPICGYALGIHPCFVQDCSEDDLLTLEKWLAQQKLDAKLLAVGEIGLDFAQKKGKSEKLDGDLNEKEIERQMCFFKKQLRLAKLYELPVLLHHRRSLSFLLTAVGEWANEKEPGMKESMKEPIKGIIHAFNGSEQQAQQAIGMGLKLGFGGAMTRANARNLQHLARTLPLGAMVLETDAPDMLPAWRYQNQTPLRNEPIEVAAYAKLIAAWRGINVEEVAHTTCNNVFEVMPKLAQLVQANR